MTAALGWGALAASSLVIGALLGLVRAWPPRLIGLVLAFGAGALISAVSFDLAEEGAQIGDPGFLGLGLAVGAITYFVLNRMMGRRSRRGNDRGSGENAGTALALGAFLDGIPEQTVLGIGIAGGEGVSVGLLVALVRRGPSARLPSSWLRRPPPARSLLGALLGVVGAYAGIGRASWAAKRRVQTVHPRSARSATCAVVA
jgi:zinc transporter, ZIP family